MAGWTRNSVFDDDRGVIDSGVPSARSLWSRIEVVHAVTYFADESTAAARAAGLRGFWMGYFGCRAAPLGDVSAEQVCEAFYNFAPEMVARAIPDAWQFAAPHVLVDVRAASAAAALRRLVEFVDQIPSRTNDLLRVAARHSANASGLPLYGANRRLPPRDDPVEELWQLCTTLREHRGDGHVAANVAANVSGLDAHVLITAEGIVNRGDLQPNRGWSDTAWDSSAASLRERGLLDSSGLTPSGRQLRAHIEDTTDHLAAGPLEALGTHRVTRLVELLYPLAKRIVANDGIPVPNPMGVPWPPQ